MHAITRQSQGHPVTEVPSAEGPPTGRHPYVVIDSSLQCIDIYIYIHT